jgi:hypothetical protein
MELILAVMRCLPDYRSLLSLLQSSRVFLDVFTAAEPQILKAILSQLLHPKPVPEALNVRYVKFPIRPSPAQTFLAIPKTLPYDRAS